MKRATTLQNKRQLKSSRWKIKGTKNKQNSVHFQEQLQANQGRKLPNHLLQHWTKVSNCQNRLNTRPRTKTTQAQYDIDCLNVFQFKVLFITGID